MTLEQSLTTPLSTLLPADRVLSDSASLAFYSRDAFRAFRARGALLAGRITPRAVVQPVNTDEVVRLIRFAGEHRIAIVPYGAGTGLMAGALSHRDGIVLDMSRMNRVVSVRPEDLLVTAEPGIVLGELHSELSKHGLVLGHDPWTRPVATLGGATSTNGLGYKGGRYGGMGDQVRGIEVVMGTGEVVQTKPLARASVGPDITRLFVGAEGTLGIITQLTVEVFRRPEAFWRRGFVFESFEEGFKAVREVTATGLRPSLLEYGDRFAVPGSRWTRTEPPTLFIGYEGFTEEVEASARRTGHICATGTIIESSEVESFWRERHDTAVRFAATRRNEDIDRPSDMQPGARVDYLHVSLPASRVLAFRKQAMSIFAEAGAFVTETGVWTRPELFSMVVAQSQTEADRGRPLAEVADDVLKLAQDSGGAMEYCHGVGAVLSHLMEREHGANGLALLQRLKRQCDPLGILNPGKLALDDGDPAHSG